MVRLAGTLSPTVAADAAYPFQFDPNQPDAVAEALVQALKDERWKGTRAHVVLDDRLVRYFIAERAEGARNLEELELAAHAQFENIFGSDAAGWEFRLNLVPFAGSYLACACDRRLLASLRQAFVSAGIPLASVQPFAIAEFNRRKPKLGNEPAWIAVVHARTVWLALASKGAFTAVRTHSLQGNLIAELPELLEREGLRHDDHNPAKQLWLLGARGEDISPNSWGKLSVVTLDKPLWPDKNKAWSNAYRLALSPVWP